MTTDDGIPKPCRSNTNREQRRAAALAKRIAKSRRRAALGQLRFGDQTVRTVQAAQRKKHPSAPLVMLRELRAMVAELRATIDSGGGMQGIAAARRERRQRTKKGGQ